jgi:predicted GIY-YIG superfamily endonuclease
MIRKERDARNVKETTILYIIQMKGTSFFKIGITKDLKSRFSAIKSDYPSSELELVGYLYCENRKRAVSYELNLHALLKHKRTQFEWFTLTHNEIVLLVEFMRTFFSGQFILEELQYKDYQKEVFTPTHNNKPYFMA